MRTHPTVILEEGLPVPAVVAESSPSVVVDGGRAGEHAGVEVRAAAEELRRAGQFLESWRSLRKRKGGGRTLPRGQRTRRSCRPSCATEWYAQSTAVCHSLPAMLGNSISVQCSFLLAQESALDLEREHASNEHEGERDRTHIGPASSTSTLFSGSSLSLRASTSPAVPPPTMMYENTRAASSPSRHSCSTGSRSERTPCTSSGTRREAGRCGSTKGVRVDAGGGVERLGEVRGAEPVCERRTAGLRAGVWVAVVVLDEGTCWQELVNLTRCVRLRRRNPHRIGRVARDGGEGSEDALLDVVAEPETLQVAA